TRRDSVVPCVNRYGGRMAAKRRDFSGDLALRIDGLPSGITMDADSMAAKVDAMPVVFEAAADAPIAGKILDVTATVSGNSARGAFKHMVEMVAGPNNNYYYSTTVDKLYVAVTE